MFSREFIDYTKEKITGRTVLFGTMQNKIEEKLSALSGEEKLLMEFLYGTMPLRDVGEYDFTVYQAYVKHALFLREHVERCKKLPEDVFLHYVLYPRINSEDIRACRSFFYGQLKDRVQGMTEEAACLEVNYWCAEQASYAAADDRTLSPMMVYQSGTGRCGEESAFTVSALRSIGIPARQVYAPWWAHCDDNHAWVEVYLDGNWFFMGACEPEEVLNKGWFLGASSRALLIHSRTFFDYWLPESLAGMDYIGRAGCVYYYNSTSLYARTARLSICVKNEKDEPAENVKVELSTLNMAEYGRLATLTTDAWGRAVITLGLGSVHIQAEQDGKVSEGWFRVDKGGNTVHLQLKAAEETEKFRELFVEAPEETTVNKGLVSPEQKSRGKERAKEAGRIRLKRMEAHYDPEKATEYPEESGILKMASGNFSELYAFCSKDCNPDRKRLLGTLSQKDYKDAKAEVLEDFLNNPYTDRADGEKAKADDFDIFQEDYANFILCPRIYHEEIVPYASFIRAYFTEAQTMQFREAPETVWDYIVSSIREIPQENYDTLIGTPIGSLKLGQANSISQKILFVAICRSLGIPARLNRESMQAEYKQGGCWKRIAQHATGVLMLQVDDDTKWIYHQTWSIGRQKWPGEYETLQYEGKSFLNNQLTLRLEAGTYRVITTNRMPNGNQYAHIHIVDIAANTESKLHLSLVEGVLSDLLCNYHIPDFPVFIDNQKRKMLSEIQGERSGILVFLEVGKEPTEHVLNEMLERGQDLSKLQSDLIFLVKNPEDLENVTLQKVLRLLSGIRIFYDRELEHAEDVARKMYVNPERLPLLAVMDVNMTGIYACSGYNVGSVDMIIKLLNLVRAKKEV